jgi:1-acyl-sn-glycerol-3-phosphate acyltransferase
MLGKELTRPMARGERSDILNVYQGFVSKMDPPPVYRGIENLPESPRFIVAANHYQRQGLWIAHAAAAVGMALWNRYGCAPPVRWIVTGNWPRWKLGPLSLPSPGDIILPRVAHALWCHAVPFAGTDPQATAASLRRLVRKADDVLAPIGVFPEGAQATAGELRSALPGVGRFLTLMARRGWPVLPAGISEQGRFVIVFGEPLTPNLIAASRDAGALVMEAISTVLIPKQAPSILPPTTVI